MGSAAQMPRASAASRAYDGSPLHGNAMATGLYATRTALGKGRFDPWLVNIDGVYHESATVPA